MNFPTFNVSCLVKICSVLLFTYLLVVLCSSKTQKTGLKIPDKQRETETENETENKTDANHANRDVNNDSQQNLTEVTIDEEWERLEDKNYMESVEKEFQERSDYVMRKCRQLSETGVKFKKLPT